MPAWPETVDTLKGDIMQEMHRPVETAPSDPTAITGTTAKMLGLALSFTPRRTGRVLVIVTGNITCDTTAKKTTVRLRYGTGAAPANDDAASGTTASLDRTFTALTGMLTVPFADVALITMTIGTAYWIDYSAVTDDVSATGRLLELQTEMVEI